MAFTPNNPNGQATSANSAPVVIASNQSDLPVRGGFLEITGTPVSSNGVDLIPSTDISNYRSFSLQVNGTFVATVQFQGSNDNTNWLSIPAVPTNNTSNVWSPNTSSTGLFLGLLNFRYIRVRSTAYTSGTITGVMEVYSQTPNYHTFGTASQLLTGTNSVGTVGLNAGTNSIGGVFTNPSTSSSAMLNFFSSSVVAASQTVKASSGRVHKLVIYNPTAALAWLQVFNTTTPTLGTTTPLQSYPIPASGIFEDFFMFGDAHTTAISIAATTTPTGSTAPTTGLVVNLGYI